MSVGIGIGYYRKSTFDDTVTLGLEINSIPVFLFIIGIVCILLGAIIQSIYEKQGKIR